MSREDPPTNSSSTPGPAADPSIAAASHAKTAASDGGEIISDDKLTWTLCAGECNHPNYGQVHEMMHRDISLGNDYRKERMKLMIVLASGVFAVTVTFHKDFFAGKEMLCSFPVLLLGWLSLLISLLIGIRHYRSWEDFYLQHRQVALAMWNYRVTHASEYAAEYRRGRKIIRTLQASYAGANDWQMATLFAGLLLIVIYVGLSSFSLAAPPDVAPAAQSKMSTRP